MSVRSQPNELVQVDKGYMPQDEILVLNEKKLLRKEDFKEDHKIDFEEQGCPCFRRHDLMFCTSKFLMPEEGSTESIELLRSFIRSSNDEMWRCIPRQIVEYFSDLWNILDFTGAFLFMTHCTLLWGGVLDTNGDVLLASSIFVIMLRGIGDLRAF